MRTSLLKNHPFIILLIIVITGFGITGCDLSNNNSSEEEEEIERSYSKSIERLYDNEFERALIDSAEAVYPPRDSVISVLDIVYPHRDNNSIIPDTGYWHRSSFDGVLIPYAITNDAIEYYSSLIEAMESGTSHQHIKSTYFTYHAHISFKEEYEFSWPPVTEAMGPDLPAPPEENFKRVFVVEMMLHWHHILVDPSGMRLEHGRVVVFNEDGTINRIFLDGVWPFSAN